MQAVGIKDMSGDDILQYLIFVGEETHEDMMSRWGEDIAYKLYESRSYHELSGYALYYIYEVVTENMKMNHFENETSSVGLRYFQKGDGLKATFKDSGAWLTRDVEITNRRDMRDLGEEHFIDFIKRYVTETVDSILTDERFGWSLSSTERMENLVHYLYFSQKEGLGMLTKVGYNDLRQYIQNLVDYGIEQEDTDPSRFIQRGKYLHNRLDEAFRLAEEVL